MSDVESPRKEDRKSRRTIIENDSESEGEVIGVERTEKERKNKRSSRKNEQSELNPAMIQAMKEAVRGCMEEMMPQIVNCITETINEGFKAKLEELDDRVAALALKGDQTRVLSAIESDRQEQYLRRDNIIIQGMKEVEGETVDKLMATVVELCHSIGVKVEKAAIGDIHRLGKRQGERNKARPVLVKSNRLVKCAVMQNKRRLRDMEMSRERWEEKITVYEDLTEARRKLREAARDAPDVSFCYSRDGTIMCKTNDGRWVDVNNYNDLLKVGVQGENLEPARYYKGLL